MAWAVFYNKKGVYEHDIAGGANEYDHIELSGFPNSAKGSETDALGF
jgi:hypothetical protein